MWFWVLGTADSTPESTANWGVAAEMIILSHARQEEQTGYWLLVGVLEEKKLRSEEEECQCQWLLLHPQRRNKNGEELCADANARNSPKSRSWWVVHPCYWGDASVFSAIVILIALLWIHQSAICMLLLLMHDVTLSSWSSCCRCIKNAHCSSFIFRHLCHFPMHEQPWVKSAADPPTSIWLLLQSFSSA